MVIAIRQLVQDEHGASAWSDVVPCVVGPAGLSLPRSAMGSCVLYLEEGLTGTPSFLFGCDGGMAARMRQVVPAPLEDTRQWRRHAAICWIVRVCG